MLAALEVEISDPEGELALSFLLSVGFSENCWREPGPVVGSVSNENILLMAGEYTCS